MECPSCTFQNAPGTQNCIRCQSLLDLQGVEFLPPRAAAAPAIRRARAVAQSTRFSIRDTWTGVGRALTIPDQYQVTWHELAWAIIPGAPQLRSEPRSLRRLGRIILGAWLTLLLIALLFLGTDVDLILAFAALSVHCFSISLVLANPLQREPMLVRLGAGLLVYLVLLFGVYRPAARGLGAFVQVLPITNIAQQNWIARGDVLLRTSRFTNPAEYRRGDLVVVRFEQSAVAGLLVQAGFSVDRLIALPGDVVETGPGMLKVNGEVVPRSHQPLAGTRGLPPMEFTAGPGQYVVIPSTVPAAFHGVQIANRAALMEQLSRFSREDVLGRVFLRVRPWSQFGRVGGSTE